MRRLPGVLAILIAVVAAVGVTTGKVRFGKSAPHYQQALAAYQAQEPEKAVAEVRKALRGSLALPSSEQQLTGKDAWLGAMRVFSVMRQVSRVNA
jgi:hypothetical protein